MALYKIRKSTETECSNKKPRQDAGVFYYLEIVISWQYLIGFD